MTAASGDGAPVRPLVRVRDAALTPDGGPIRVTVSRLASPEAVSDALAPAGARTTVAHGRLTTVTTTSRLVDAVGRALGRPAADALDTALTAAVAAWHGPPPDLQTPAGVVTCSRRPVVVGVVNVTPDSFFDGGRYYAPPTHPGPAIDHGRALIDAGADLVDVGGQSTRPGSEPVSEDVELDRVVPVVEALADGGAVVSVDTTKAAVARAAVGAGAAVVNDVSAGAFDDELLPTVAELRVPYVLMHMQGTPRTMQREPTYTDVVAEVFEFLAEGLERSATAGIEPTSVVVDPGIGFGKTVADNLELLRDVRELTCLGRPVMVGTSRKSFLGRITGGLAADARLEASIVTAALAVARGASIVRVHDVTETVRALRAVHAVATGRWS